MVAVDPEGVSWVRLTRGGAVNAGAAVIASGAGLAVVLLAGRTMTPAAYASFASVWGLIFGGAAVLGALEQETARSRSLIGVDAERAQFVVAALVAVGAAGCMSLVVAVLHGPLHVSSPSVAVLVIATAAAFPSMFLARGFLAGALRFSGLAVVTAGEALIRLAVVILGFGLTLPTVPVVAAAALCGAMIGVPFLTRRAGAGWTWPSVWGSLRRTATLMVGNGLSAVLLTGAPVLVSLSMAGSSTSVIGRTQAAVVVSRFPLIGLQLLQSLLIPVFVRRRSLTTKDYPMIVCALVGIIPIAAVVSFLAGPWFLASLYGTSYAVAAPEMSLLTAGATALGCVQVLVALAVSGDRHRLSPLAFVPTLTVTVAVALLAPAPAAMRISLALAAGPAAGLVVALIATARWRRELMAI